MGAVFWGLELQLLNGTVWAGSSIIVSTCAPKVSESKTGSFSGGGERHCRGWMLWMWHLGTWGSGGLGSAGGTVGIDGLRGLLQSK